jgi:hypothetical protein
MSTTPRGPDVEIRPGGGVDRRAFVTLVSASLAAQWLAAPRWLGSATTAAMPEGPALVPGYLRGSSTLVSDDATLQLLSHGRTPFHDAIRAALSPLMPLELIPATELDRVEPLEGSRAQVQVHGLLPPDGVREDRGLRSAELLVRLMSADQPDPPAFVAWSYERLPVEQLAGGSSFTLPLGDDVRMRLAVRVQRGVSDDHVRSEAGAGEAVPVSRRPQVYVVDLPAADEWGLPRLRPGLYAIPLSLEAQRSVPLPANRDWLVPLDLQFLMFSVRSVDG